MRTKVTSRHSPFSRRLWLLVCVVAAALPITACDSSGSRSENAAITLAKTFGGTHAAKSGVIDLNVKVVPSGSSIIDSPLTLTITGPFVAGTDTAPGSADLQVNFSGLDLKAAAELIEVRGRGYLKVSGSAYKLPAAQLGSFRSGETKATATTTVGTTALTKALRQNWRQWLIDPKVSGHAQLDGVETEIISGQLDAKAVLEIVRSEQLTLVRAGSTSAKTKSNSVTRTLSEIQIDKFAQAVGSPSFEVWTDADDHVLRQLVVSFKSRLNHGIASVKSAAVTITLNYQQLNAPERVATPTQLKPFSELQRKFDPIFKDLFGSGQLARIF